MEETICETPITGQYLAKHLRESLGPKAILSSYEAKKIAVGQGYVSNILHLKLSWEPTVEDGLPATIIVKAPAVESLHKLFETMTRADAEESEKMRAMTAQMVTVVHKAECDFYDLVKTSPPCAMPKVYVALPVTEEAPGMIVLEDLSEKGIVIPNLIEGLTYPQIISAIKEVARLHAWSLTTSVDWRSKVPKIEDRAEMFKAFLAPLMAGFKITKETYPDHLGHINVEKLLELCTFESFFNLFKEHQEFVDDVLMHGDFHAMNMMYEKNKDGTIGDQVIALLDFQAVLIGSPAYDVARLLTFSVSPEIRQKNIDKIKQAYYDEMKLLAGDKFKITYDQMSKLIDRQYAAGVAFMVSSIPTLEMILIKSEGEQKEKDKQKILEMAKIHYDDAAVILGF